MRIVFIVIILVLSTFGLSKAQNKQNDNVKVTKIWDAAPYNAFTDIIRFNNKFYCVFREGTGHVPKKDGTGNGRIRIISSKNGKTWKSVALLKNNGWDLRDPKISITPDGRLMVNMGGSRYRGAMYKGKNLLYRLSFVSFSDLEGNEFSDPEPVNIDGSIESQWDWLWRITWHAGAGYGVIYQDFRFAGKKKIKAYIVKTTNGTEYSLITQLKVKGLPNESTVRIKPNGEMFIIVRREGGDKSGYLGSAMPPYTTWTWYDTGVQLGGPDFIFLPNGKLLVGTRSYNKNESNTTGLYVGNFKGNLKKIIDLPAGNGDTGYPGLLIYNDTLWVSYYHSSKVAKTSIYLAKIPLSYIDEKN